MPVVLIIAVRVVVVPVGTIWVIVVALVRPPSRFWAPWLARASVSVNFGSLLVFMGIVIIRLVRLRRTWFCRAVPIIRVITIAAVG